MEGRHEDDKETAEQLEEIFKVPMYNLLGSQALNPDDKLEANLVLDAEF